MKIQANFCTLFRQVTLQLIAAGLTQGELKLFAVQQPGGLSIFLFHKVTHGGIKQGKSWSWWGRQGFRALQWLVQRYRTTTKLLQRSLIKWRKRCNASPLRHRVPFPGYLPRRVLYIEACYKSAAACRRSFSANTLIDENEMNWASRWARFRSAPAGLIARCLVNSCMLKGQLDS